MYRDRRRVPHFRRTFPCGKYDICAQPYVGGHLTGDGVGNAKPKRRLVPQAGSSVISVSSGGQLNRNGNITIPSPRPVYTKRPFSSCRPV